MEQIDTARERMNHFGRSGTPFFFMIDFLQQHPVVLSFEEIYTEEILFQTPIANFLSDNDQNDELPIQHIDIFPRPLDEYRQQFDRVISEIKKGNSFLMNLTDQTPIKLNTDLRTVFHHAKAKYKLWYRDQFVCFSPETFVTISEGTIRTYPMKGTINASTPAAKEQLLNSIKEKAEHYTIVDLLRNDLSMVAERVAVTKLRYIEEIAMNWGTLLQASTEIEGTLPFDYQSRLGNIIFTMLPAGSVTGAPKKKTVQILCDTEQYARGYYTGVFGVFDGYSLDSAVMIRFIEKTATGYVYKSGGGITALSNCLDEYNELVEKIYVPIY
ncbi:aminodeoxychorismate synthase component I [Microbacter margulisiae]|uniref:Para-aminobenzoate synthetase component 1 n=1 Tax=Microbacter margulisiae TaxID=1350067 RepID=A0A7W5H1L2_9PORP|nr:aminodeoxychorismate synthase component I [Microbacter margulisiae]MBB3186501.1 para-aminobenzoate synthetase component 1 [Microbacter margulisiae]